MAPWKVSVVILISKETLLQKKGSVSKYKFVMLQKPFAFNHMISGTVY